MPKISILTPVLADTQDKVNWLRECVESVASQDFQDWEMIVVDDSSPLLVGEALVDPRVVYAKAVPRQGTSMCRNTAAALAKGDALLPLDADDKLPPGALSILWEAWSKHKDRIVYGNAQQFGLADRFLPFPKFEKLQDVLNLQGIVPVSAMHSWQTWKDAGGWKKEFSHGLEDVEYWIGAAAAGHCGLKIEETTLMYRKHSESRSARMKRAGEQSRMEELIRERHKDIYGGNYPMGCCGGGGSRAASNPPPMKSSKAEVSVSGDKILVRYNGNQQGKFGVVSQVDRKTTYWVDGPGSTFAAHAADARFLSRLGKGKDFTVGIPAPVEEKIPEPPKEVPKYQAPEPELAQIERMPEAIPPLVEVFDDTEVIDARKDPLEGITASDEVRAMLRREGWTVPALARAQIDELTTYKGIGKVTAGKLIEEAKTLWS